MNFEVDDYTENSVTLSWDEVGNATAYEVYVALDDGDKLFTTTAETSVTVTELEKNQEYTFKVCGIIQGDEIRRGALAEVVGCTYREKVGEVTSFLVSADNLTLKWDKVEADGYEVYSFDEETGAFLLENSVSENNCKIVNLKPETEYEFKIVPFKTFSIGKIYGQETVFKASTIGENDISVKVENVTPDSYTLVWNEIENTDGYDVFVLNDQSQEFEIFAENVTDTRYDVTELSELSSKTYKVMPYQMVDGEKFSFGMSAEVVATTNLSSAKITLAPIENGVKVSWEKIDKASGYVIYYSQTLDEDVAVAGTVEDNATTNFTINNLNGGENYYIKVVSYVEIDGQKVYGEEAVESCTTKKKDQTTTSNSNTTDKKTTTTQKTNKPTYNKKNFIDVSVSGSDFELSDERWNDISKLVKNYSWSNTSSFALYDINSGVKITYNADWYVSTASTVKAGYVTYVISQEIDKGNAKFSDVLTYEKRFYNNGSGNIKYSSYGTKYTIKEVIHLILETSDNCGYLMLQDHFGVKNYNKWLKSMGCETFVDGVNTKFGNVSANDSCRIWQEIYKYFNNGKNGEFLKKEFLGTGYSPIRNTLGDKYKVANKFGGSALGWHDTGIVFAGNNPYIMVILTNDSYMHPDTNFQTSMIKQLNGLHDDLLKYLKEQKQKEEEAKKTTTTKKPTTTLPTTTTTPIVTTTPPVTTTPEVTTPTVTTEEPPIVTTPETTTETPETTTSQTTTEIPTQTTTADTEETTETTAVSSQEISDEFSEDITE